MQYTTNQNLKKPETTDHIRISDLNENADKLDGLIPSVASSTNQLADKAYVASQLTSITEKIPSQATAENQLADKSFVNSSIATQTGNYISNNGEPFTSVAQLEAYSGTVTNNDYAFVSGTDAQSVSYYDRYKAAVSGSTVTWAKEYRLNNSSFTSSQWAAIQSGLSSTDKTKLDGIESNAEVNIIEGIQLNGADLTPDANRKVNVTTAMKLVASQDYEQRKTTSEDPAYTYTMTSGKNYLVCVCGTIREYNDSSIQSYPFTCNCFVIYGLSISQYAKYNTSNEKEVITTDGTNIVVASLDYQHSVFQWYHGQRNIRIYELP